MALFLRRHCWPVLQVVAIVVCYQNKVLSVKTAEDCVESRLSLSCPGLKVIEVIAVVLGDTYCQGSSCCIRDSDCTRIAKVNHIRDVHLRCDGKRSCTVNVTQEKITCGYLSTWAYNDFERIIYNCIGDPPRSTIATSSRPCSTEDNLCTEDDQPEKEAENDDTTSPTGVENEEGSEQNGGERNDERIHTKPAEDSWLLPVVMATICLLVLIAIVVVVVMMRRKRWPKASTAVEMTYNDSSDGDEAIYSNENQTTALNNGARSPIYSNDKIKRSKQNGANASETYEVPNDVVYSLANDADARPTEASDIYCDVESRGPAYEVPTPRANIYSVVRDIGGPECAGSRVASSNEDNNVYSEVETREPAKVTDNSAQDVYDEACNWKESEYKAVNAEKDIPAAHKKKTDSPAHKTAPNSDFKANKPSNNASYSNVEAKGNVSTSDGFPSPTYETMSPGIPECIYANEPALSPSWSVASRALSTRGSETESAYCDMQSPQVRFKDDGGHMLVDNDLYSH